MSTQVMDNIINHEQERNNFQKTRTVLRDLSLSGKGITWYWAAMARKTLFLAPTVIDKY